MKNISKAISWKGKYFSVRSCRAKPSAAESIMACPILQSFKKKDLDFFDKCAELKQNMPNILNFFHCRDGPTR